MTAHSPAHSPHIPEKSPAHYKRNLKKGVPLKALAGAVLEKSLVMCECAHTRARTTAHYTQTPHIVPHITRTLQKNTPRQIDQKDPGRTWAPNNPFVCECGFKTGWLRDGKPLCPACDGKPPAGMPEGPRLNDVDPGIPSTGPCLICGVPLDQDGAECWHRAFHLRTTTPAPPKPRNVGISPIALSWLRENRAELKQYGWTMAELYRRNKSRGIVWVKLWSMPGLSVAIEGTGCISFQFVTATGQKIRQTAWPKRIPPKRSSSK